MKVFLNIVGGQFGAFIDVGDIGPEGPSVLDVLDKAEHDQVEADNGVTFRNFNLNNRGTIGSITLEITREIPSRKSRPGDSDQTRPKFSPKTYTLEENFGLTTPQGFAEPLVFQYYIEKLRAVTPKVTTTYSIDDVIVAAADSKSKVRI